MATFRIFTRRVFILLNIIAVFLFLLACANAFLHPGSWWIISLLGLVFPLLLLIVVVFLIAWLFVPGRRNWAWFSIAALLIGWSNIRSFIAFHPGQHFAVEKPPHSLRILTWNVRSWDEFMFKKGVAGHRSGMMEFIGQQQADVMCFQEFFESHNPREFASNIPYIQQQLHYPYYYFSHDYGRNDGMYEAGVIIFSRYPITDTLLIHYSHPEGYRTTESLIAVDIEVAAGRRVRVFTTHLQSVQFRHKDFHDIEIIKNVDDSILRASWSIAKKLKIAFLHRGDQAEEVRAQLDKSPYPGIICGDFNDVPNSYTYFTIRGAWQDAFIKKGFGIGRTYMNISPTLRIDYILADPRLEVLQCRKFDLPYSDHHPVIADLKIP